MHQQKDSLHSPPPAPHQIRSFSFSLKGEREREGERVFLSLPRERIFLLLALSSRLVLEPREWGGGDITLIFKSTFLF